MNVRLQADRGHQIEAIKLIRETTHASLRNAKAWLDNSTEFYVAQDQLYAFFAAVERLRGVCAVVGTCKATEQPPPTPTLTDLQETLLKVWRDVSRLRKHLGLSPWGDEEDLFDGPTG